MTLEQEIAESEAWFEKLTAGRLKAKQTLAGARRVAVESLQTIRRIDGELFNLIKRRKQLDRLSQQQTQKPL